MGERNGAGVGGVRSTAEPASGTVNVEADSPVYANRTPASQAEIQSVRRARIDAARQHIAALSELFPACIVADKWETHRQLKVGIYHRIVSPDRGQAGPTALLLSPAISARPRAGGERVDFSGAPVGEVTPDEIEHARAAVAKMEVKRIAKAEAARQENKRIARRANGPSPRPPPAAPTPPSSECTAPRLLGLDDLKRAALARRLRGIDPDICNDAGAERRHFERWSGTMTDESECRDLRAFPQGKANSGASRQFCGLYVCRAANRRKTATISIDAAQSGFVWINLTPAASFCVVVQKSAFHQHFPIGTPRRHEWSCATVKRNLPATTYVR